jgi:hypothetical protein
LIHHPSVHPAPAHESRHAGDSADEQLMRRVARRDARAFSELYDRHATAAYRLALRT